MIIDAVGAGLQAGQPDPPRRLRSAAARRSALLDLHAPRRRRRRASSSRARSGGFPPTVIVHGVQGELLRHRRRRLRAGARGARAARRARAPGGGRARRVSGRALRRALLRRPATPSSQPFSAPTPSPVRALTSMCLTPGCTCSRFSRKRSIEKSRCSSRSILLITTSSQVRNISGYFRGLVLALGDGGDHRARVLADAELRGAHEVADVLDHQQVDRAAGRSRRSAERTMFASRWHSPPKPGDVFSCVTGTCSADSRSASSEPAMSPSSTPAPEVAQPVDQDTLEQRGLARPGRAHQVHDAHAGAVEVRAVGARDRRVGVEHVARDPHLGSVHRSSSTSM